MMGGGFNIFKKVTTARIGTTSGDMAVIFDYLKFLLTILRLLKALPGEKRAPRSLAT